MIKNVKYQFAPGQTSVIEFGWETPLKCFALTDKQRQRWYKKGGNQYPLQLREVEVLRIRMKEKLESYLLQHNRWKWRICKMADFARAALPWIVIGLGIAIFVAHGAKKKE